MDGVADHGVVRRVIVVDAVVAVAIGEVANQHVVGGHDPCGLVPIDVDTTVLVTVGNVVDHRVIAGAIELDPRGIAHHNRCIGEGDIFADQVVIAAIDDADADAGIVIGDVVGDGGIVGVVQHNALNVQGRVGWITGVMHAVVRDGDVIRVQHVDALTACLGNGEASDDDVAPTAEQEGAVVFGFGIDLTGDGHTRITLEGDGLALNTVALHRHCFWIRARQNPHGIPRLRGLQRSLTNGAERYRLAPRRAGCIAACRVGIINVEGSSFRRGLNRRRG